MENTIFRAVEESAGTSIQRKYVSRILVAAIVVVVARRRRRGRDVDSQTASEPVPIGRDHVQSRECDLTVTERVDGSVLWSFSPPHLSSRPRPRPSQSP